MCGIYTTNISFSDEQVKSKLASIEFRGPDNTGILTCEEITLGHLRLAIVDLDVRSNQPLTLDHLHIVFNGEIYNFQEIREQLILLGHNFTTASDTEVLLASYKEWGEDFVPRLNGMFAFCIYDSKQNTMFCARDRVGVKPFYYYWKDGKFEICSQLRPISPGRSISSEAVSIFLECTYIPSPYSIYQDVYKLEPGHCLKINLSDKTFKINKYWDLKTENIRESELSYEDAKNKLHELLKDAVKIRLQSDVPIGSFLSGGIDSALISSIASKVSKDQIKTFSIGFDNPQYDESKIAAQYAEIMHSKHTETICKPEDVLGLIPKLIEVYDEPFGDSSALPSLLLNSVTKKYVTVALSGDGGDESFLGYYHFDWVSKFEKLIKVPFIIRAFISGLLPSSIFKHRKEIFRNILKTKSIDDFIFGVFLGFNSILKTRDNKWLSNYCQALTLSKNPIQKAADLNIKLWLENDSNVKTDRASMAYAVEIRSPFLDYRIIEFARTLPISYRYEAGRKKKILRDILKEYIPEEIFNQPKRGFAVPIGEWIRKELKEEFMLNLSDDFLELVPNLHMEKFKKMFKLHLAGEHDYSSYIWRVYVLSKWYQEFGFAKKIGLARSSFSSKF